MIYIFWSCKSEEEAKEIIKQLLEEKLIACASIFPKVLSMYRWKGTIETTIEVKVVLKTEKKHFFAIEEVIHKASSYEVPEVVAIASSQVSSSYLSWLKKELL